MTVKNKTVSIPEWGYEAMVALREALKRKGAAPLPDGPIREFAEKQLAEDGDAFSRGYVLAISAWALNQMVQQRLAADETQEDAAATKRKR